MLKTLEYLNAREAVEREALRKHTKKKTGTTFKSKADEGKSSMAKTSKTKKGSQKYVE